MTGNVCCSVTKDCYNFYDSYGEICVWCNCCGRVDKKTMYRARLELMKRMQESNENFKDWAYEYPELMETQKRNVESNKIYYAEKIAVLEKIIAEKAGGETK